MSTTKARTREEEVDYAAFVIETMVKAVVDQEDKVEVRRLVGHANVVFEVIVEDRDMAFAMGQNGRAVEAMRIVLNGMCKKLRIKYQFTILSRQQVGP